MFVGCAPRGWPRNVVTSAAALARTTVDAAAICKDDLFYENATDNDTANDNTIDNAYEIGHGNDNDNDYDTCRITINQKHDFSRRFMHVLSASEIV